MFEVPASVYLGPQSVGNFKKHLMLSFLVFSGLAQAWPSKAKRENRRLRSEIQREMDRHIGKPYVWNRFGPDAFDCSGFVYHVLSTALGKQRFSLPYSLSGTGYKAQSVFYRDTLAKAGARIDCADARESDIVFFHPAGARDYNHIGIVTDPMQRLFVTAQGPGIGVQPSSYSQGSFWGKKSHECYNNIWTQED